MGYGLAVLFATSIGLERSIFPFPSKSSHKSHRDPLMLQSSWAYPDVNTFFLASKNAANHARSSSGCSDIFSKMTFQVGEVFQ